MDKGYIMLSRKFFTNDIWQAARAYNESEAWLDLIQSARFEASETTSRIGGREITWGRGQYPASNRFLAKKWGRSETWVKATLARFKKMGMIQTECTQGMNVITLLNFDRYNYIENPQSNPPRNPLNEIDISELQALLTRLKTHQETHTGENTGFSQILKPSVSPNNNKENTLRESLNTREELFNNFKDELLGDEEWRRYACQISGLSVAFNDLIPGELDNFLAWMVSTGEGDTLKTIDDVKRRFTYWWQGTGLRAYNQRHNGGTRKETFGGYTSHAGAYGKREAPAKTGVQPSEEARKDYTERF